jgi:hypothetical protein
MRDNGNSFEMAVQLPLDQKKKKAPRLAFVAYYIHIFTWDRLGSISMVLRVEAQTGMPPNTVA